MPVKRKPKPSMATSLFSVAPGNARFLDLQQYDEGQQVWVRAPGKRNPRVWERGEVIVTLGAETDEKQLVVVTESNEKLTTSTAFAADKDKETVYADMTAMKYVNEPQILSNLELRSYKDHPYTFLGPVLVAVNPLAATPEPAKSRTKTQLINTPHPYAIAELAYQQMSFGLRLMPDQRESPVDQTVVVSGESGAGKTVNSKKVLEHLVARSSSASGDSLKDAMLGSNPVLESLGNAQTLRNANSSRFGKMFYVCFEPDATAGVYPICGARIGTYLLERSRIATHEVGERNYHVFYELMTASDEILKDLLIDKGKVEFKILHATGQNETLVQDRDKGNFDLLIQSLKFVGVTEDRVRDILKVVSAVLHLGNIEFEEHIVSGVDGSKVSAGTRHHLVSAAELLGVSADQLEVVFTKVKVQVNGDVQERLVSVAHAPHTLSAVYKSVYSRLFDFVVHTVNAAINKGESTVNKPTIGVLDIFGFETFHKNDLEQLLINYTNEALQMTFNKQVLEAEAALYKREGLGVSESEIDALDPGNVVDEKNRRCIELLQGSVRQEMTKKGKIKMKKMVGVLDVIHQQGEIKPKEEKMLEALHKTFGGAKNPFPNYKVNRKDRREAFYIMHYAGKVKYTVGSFLLKNNDSLPKSANELFLSSVKEVIRDVWAQSSEAAGKKKKKKKASIVSKFKVQISSLMEDLDKTQCSFIRCIKPNAAMHRNEGWFDRRYVSFQLKNLSISKTADVLKAGLPTRLAYDQLLEKYAKIFEGHLKVPQRDDENYENDSKGFITALFFAFEVPRDAYKLGLTRVFFKSGDLDKLEEVMRASDQWLDSKDDPEMLKIVERFKSYHRKRKWMVVFAKALAANIFVKMLARQRKYKADLLKAAIFSQKLWRARVARFKVAELRHAKQLEEERIAREKAEQERLEQERLAEEARQRELEELERIRKEKEAIRERIAKEKAEEEARKKREHAEMMAEKKRREKQALLERQEKEKREREKAEAERRERERKEEEERLKKLEELRLAREEEDRKAREAADKARLADQDYKDRVAQLEYEDIRRNPSVRMRMSNVAEMRMNQEKMREAEQEKKVIEDFMKNAERERDELEYQRVVEETEEGEDEDEWMYYDDIDADDTASEESEDVLADALNFLDNLSFDSDAEEDGDDGEDFQSIPDMDETDDEDEEDAYTKEFTGPYMVNVNVKKLESTQQNKRVVWGFGLKFENWKQCFAFVFPDKQKILISQSPEKTFKLEFTPDAHSKASSLRGGKKNVLHIVGVRFTNKESDKNNVRELMMEFQDADRRNLFKRSIKDFVKEEAAKEVRKPSAKGKSNFGGFAANTGYYASKGERRDAIAVQTKNRFYELKRAKKAGKLNDADILRLMKPNNTTKYDDDEDVSMDELTSCINKKCQRSLPVGEKRCPHCGTIQ